MIQANSLGDLDEEETEILSPEELYAQKLAFLQRQPNASQGPLAPEDYEWNMQAIAANDLDESGSAAQNEFPRRRAARYRRGFIGIRRRAAGY